MEQRRRAEIAKRHRGRQQAPGRAGEESCRPARRFGARAHHGCSSRRTSPGSPRWARRASRVQPARAEQGRVAVVVHHQRPAVVAVRSRCGAGSPPAAAAAPAAHVDVPAAVGAQRDGRLGGKAARSAVACIAVLLLCYRNTISARCDTKSSHEPGSCRSIADGAVDPPRPASAQVRASAAAEPRCASAPSRRPTCPPWWRWTPRSPACTRPPTGSASTGATASRARASATSWWPRRRPRLRLRDRRGARLEFGAPPCGWLFAIDVMPSARQGGVGGRLLIRSWRSASRAARA